MTMRTDAILQSMVDDLGPFSAANLAYCHESAIQTSATAALVVRPSTVSAITIWNGENLGGKSLVMDRLFSHQLVSTATAAFCGLWYCVHLEMTKPTNDITALRGTGDGREPVNSLVIVDVGATVLDDGWFPCGGGLECEPTGVLPGGNLEWECNGRLVVPPHHGISLQVVSSKTSETFTSGASWWRIQL